MSIESYFAWKKKEELRLHKELVELNMISMKDNEYIKNFIKSNNIGLYD